MRCANNGPTHGGGTCPQSWNHNPHNSDWCYPHLVRSVVAVAVDAAASWDDASYHRPSWLREKCSSCCPDGGRQDNSPKGLQSRETPLWPARSSASSVLEPGWLKKKWYYTHCWPTEHKYLLSRRKGRKWVEPVKRLPQNPAVHDGRGSPFRLHAARWPRASLELGMRQKSEKKKRKNTKSLLQNTGKNITPNILK